MCCCPMLLGTYSSVLRPLRISLCKLTGSLCCPMSLPVVKANPAISLELLANRRLAPKRCSCLFQFQPCKVGLGFGLFLSPRSFAVHIQMFAREVLVGVGRLFAKWSHRHSCFKSAFAFAQEAHKPGCSQKPKPDPAVSLRFMK